MNSNTATALATVELYQRTALGSANDQRDSTKVYIYCPVEGYPGLVAEVGTTDYQEDMFDFYRGYVVVNHPAVMWGSLEETQADMRKVALKAVIDLGLVEANDYGSYLWRS